MEITNDDKLALGNITTRNEAGQHFTEIYGAEWLERMVDLGYITINRPVHAATGIAYGQSEWSLAVAPDVASWFDVRGNIIA